LNFELFEYNNLRNLEEKLAKFGPKVASVMIEPIQGEKGIIIPSKGELF
jgi:glutamate-1-semialdehyde aminotransferase